MKFRILLGVSILAAVISACQLSQILTQPGDGTQTPAVPETPVSTTAPVITATIAAQTSTPTTISAPSNTPTTVTDTLVVVPVRIDEDNQSPRYLIQVEYPHIEGAQGEVVVAFNRGIDDVVLPVVEDFKAQLYNPPGPVYTPSSHDDPAGINSLYLEYQVLNTSNNLLSVLLNFSTYGAGAAHPLPFSGVYNFNIRSASPLRLADLFTPGTDYLGRLAELSEADLRRQDRLEFTEGLQPIEGNYKSWNITNDGLRITFDPYQVTSYAMGYQTVTIPYNSLKDIIAMQGPLAVFVQ